MFQVHSDGGPLCLVTYQGIAMNNTAIVASGRCPVCSVVQVAIEHVGGTTVLTVEDDQSILEAALDQGLELSHDCKMGVCMTCPARLV